MDSLYPSIGLENWQKNKSTSQLTHSLMTLDMNEDRATDLSWRVLYAVCVNVFVQWDKRWYGSYSARIIRGN